MEDPNLIATLIPVDQWKLAEKALLLGENQDRRLSPKEGPPIPSREATPAQENPDDDHREYDSTHRLQLTFVKEPKDPTKEYSFGTNSQICDVLLGPRGARAMSGLHFCITFDVISNEKRLILRDSSTHGTAVSYNGQAEKEVRRHFTWILNLEKRRGSGILRV